MGRGIIDEQDDAPSVPRVTREDGGRAHGHAPSRVVILGNVRLYRDALAATLRTRDGVQVIAASECSPATVAETILNRPDVVLIDAAERASLYVVRALRRQLPLTKLIAVAVDHSESDAFNLVEAGASGCVASEASIDDLLRLIGKRLATRGRQDYGSGDQDSLTCREQQVVELLCQGLSNKEIAHAFHISEATVKNHVHNVLEKLNVNRRSQVAARAPMAWRLRVPW